MATKKRLIDANKLAENWFYTNDTGTKVVELLEIEQAPTVDAVEVVRCKDCENWQKPWLVDQTLGVCQIGKKSLTEPYHFCSYGERKCNGC